MTAYQERCEREDEEDRLALLCLCARCLTQERTRSAVLCDRCRNRYAPEPYVEPFNLNADDRECWEGCR